MGILAGSLDHVDNELEMTHAKRIREDERQIQVRGDVGRGSEEEGGAYLQRETSERRTASQEKEEMTTPEKNEYLPGAEIVNGMGEVDVRGSYVRLAIGTPEGVQFIYMSRGSVDVMLGELYRVLNK